MNESWKSAERENCHCFVTDKKVRVNNVVEMIFSLEQELTWTQDIQRSLAFYLSVDQDFKEFLGKNMITINASFHNIQTNY